MDPLTQSCLSRAPDVGGTETVTPCSLDLAVVPGTTANASGPPAGPSSTGDFLDRRLTIHGSRPNIDSSLFFFLVLSFFGAKLQNRLGRQLEGCIVLRLEVC